MEKIKLNTLEFNVKDICQHDATLSFTICGINDFKKFRNILTKDNLSKIEVYSEGGVLSTIYENYIELIGKFDITENEDGMLDVTTYLKKPDPLTQKIAELEAEIAELKALNMGI